MAAVERIVLIGFSGTGKSTIARLLAQQLGWTAADTDEEIERSWGVSIPVIFRDHGEAAFRESERATLGRLLSHDHLVIATGGGAPVAEAAWGRDLLGREGTIVLALDAEPETILARLRRQAAQEGEAVERPLLAGADPLQRIHSLKSERQQVYDRAHLTIAVDHLDASEVAAELAAVVRSIEGEPLTVRLDATSATSLISVARGALQGIGGAIRGEWPRAQRVWIVTDTHVGPLHANRAEQSLRDAGFSVATYAVAPGEGSKSLGTTSELYDWMLGNGVERGDVVVALGGGVVGDLAGFVAATVLRGIGFVQVPTSLLAAVDSSVGGKTGINHAAGKNLIGAFLQPRLVIVDTEVLRTLPPRELRAGWGEVVKHALIQRSTPGGERNDLASVLRRNAPRIRCLEEPATSYLIWRNIALKAAVVTADEREMGIRAYLNFGHTLGHAIEASDYHLLHGEAVAVGMRAEGWVGVEMGTCSDADAQEIEAALRAFDLPLAARFDSGTALERMTSDKKRVAGRQRFVLPLAGGGVVVRDDVPDSAVERALELVNHVAAAP